MCGYIDEEYPNGHYGLGSPCNELRMTDEDTLEEAYEKVMNFMYYIYMNISYKCVWVYR